MASGESQPDADAGASGPGAAETLEHSILGLGLALALAAVIAQSAGHATWAYLWHMSALNADNDESVFAWASTAIVFAAAAFSFLLAMIMPAWRKRLFLLGVVLAFLSLDDLVQLHEKAGGLAHSLNLWSQANRAVGLVVFAPVLAACLWLLWAFSRELAEAQRRHIRRGLVFLVAGVLLEFASQLVRRAGFSGPDPPYLIEVVLEEGSELAGWILIATGLVAAACSALVELGREEALRRPVPKPLARI